MWLQLNKWLYRDHLISNEMIYKNLKILEMKKAFKLPTANRGIKTVLSAER